MSVYDNSISARTYISYIAESAGCFAFIGRDGKLYLKSIYEQEAEIPLELFAEYKWGEKIQISKLSYEDGIRSFKFGNDTGYNLWVNQENMYIVNEEQIRNIFQKINGITIDSFEGRTIIDPAIDIGDKIKIGEKQIIYQGEMTLEGRFIAEISSKIQIKQKQETTTKYESTNQKIRRVQSSISQQEAKINLLTEEQDEIQTKVSELNINLDGISTKVENNLDFLGIVEGKGQLKLEDSLDANILFLSVHSEKHREEMYLFPGNMYPGRFYPTQKYKHITIIVDKRDRNAITNEAKKYVLEIEEPLDRIGEIYDELIVQSDTKKETCTVKILRRLRNGKILEEQEVQEIGEIPIKLFKQISYLYILEFPNWIMHAEYMKNVELNKWYAAKVEMNSTITQNSEQIMTEVKKKVDEDEFASAINQTSEKIMSEVKKKVGENEIISKINQSAEEISIEANKINLQGYTTINNGFSVDQNGKMSCNDATINGRRVDINGNGSNITLRVMDNNSSEHMVYVHPYAIGMNNGSSHIEASTLGSLPALQLYVEGGGSTWIDSNGIVTPTITQTSLKEYKKNIEEFEEALNIVENSKIYKYNLRTEGDGDKKHVGFIIGENYSTPNQVIAQNGKGIDIYSMVSILWKSVQELSSEILELKKGKEVK